MVKLVVNNTEIETERHLNGMINECEMFDVKDELADKMLICLKNMHELEQLILSLWLARLDSIDKET